jgi:pseudo-rSAM protein
LKLNIAGGDIFSYPLLDEITEIFNDHKDKIHFWSHCKNMRASEHPVTWEIIVDFPVDRKILEECISFCINEKARYHWHFIVQNEAEISLAEKMTDKFDIQNFEMRPYYNGANDDFFKECIFPGKEDILGDVVSQRRIFCNQSLNSNFFGALTVLPTGDITANLNAPVLGNIAATSLLELITKELEQNTAWRKTRNTPPCNNCLLQYLCPPPSNYEAALEKENLCMINENN